MAALPVDVSEIVPPGRGASVIRAAMLWTATVLPACVAGCAEDMEVILSAGPVALEDPIPEPITKGDLVVEAVEFVRLPRTEDPNKLNLTNDAYARVQTMVAFPDGSGRLAVTDLRGLVYLTDQSGAPPSVYMDLRARDIDFFNDAFPNESGLLGFAFHPHFGQPGTPGYGRFYTAFSSGSDSGEADYLDESGSGQESVVREWTATDPAAGVFEGESREVLRVGQFESYHNIGRIAFDPGADENSANFGLLHVAMGDGGGANDPRSHGQNAYTPLGTILRIDPLGKTGGRRYGIPRDNPFASGNGGLGEVWAYGLRHPQHFSWAPGGTMFITDIGQDHIEEINIGVAGANYGWPLREGTFATGMGTPGGLPGSVYSRLEDDRLLHYPVAQYDHDEGFAVGGGFVYAGSAVPELRGKFVFTELARGRLFHIETAGLEPGEPASIEEIRIIIDGRERELADVAGIPDTYRAGAIARVGLRLAVDSEGELYLLTKGDGRVRRVVSPGHRLDIAGVTF